MTVTTGSVPFVTRYSVGRTSWVHELRTISESEVNLAVGANESSWSAGKKAALAEVLSVGSSL